MTAEKRAWNILNTTLFNIAADFKTGRYGMSDVDLDSLNEDLEQATGTYLGDLAYCGPEVDEEED